MGRLGFRLGARGIRALRTVAMPSSAVLSTVVADMRLTWLLPLLAVYTVPATEAPLCALLFESNTDSALRVTFSSS